MDPFLNDWEFIFWSVRMILWLYRRIFVLNTCWRIQEGSILIYEARFQLAKITRQLIKVQIQTFLKIKRENIICNFPPRPEPPVKFGELLSTSSKNLTSVWNNISGIPVLRAWLYPEVKDLWRSYRRIYLWLFFFFDGSKSSSFLVANKRSNSLIRSVL